MGDIYLPPIVGQYLTANIPLASGMSGLFIAVTDIPGVGQGLMWSDGSIWHSVPFSAQKLRVQTAADGTYTWTYPIAYPAGYIPRISALAEAVAGTTDVINAQVDGVPTNTQAKFRVTRSALTLVNLLGITIAVPVATPGATWLHIEVFG